MTDSKPKPGRPGSRAGLSPLELAVLGLFFLSGASALVYEVVWTRDLTNVFGGSAYAIATVLAAYMAGLALGSAVFGRVIDRRGHPLVVYGVLEGAIGLWALILPVLLGLLNHVYAQIYQSLDPGFYGLSLVRFVLCFLLLLVPTTMMGGTLPVLGKLLLSNWGGLGTRAGLLYGINTLGAVVGVAAGGFWLLPTLGLRGSTWVAIVFNLFVAAVAVIAARRLPYRPAPAPAPRTERQTGDRSPALRRAVLIVYTASGFAALAYEVAWTKTLSMILGTTTYAFTSMLTTFLLGLALGSFIFGKLADRKRVRPETLLVLVQLGIPILALLSIPWLGRLPQLFVDGFPRLRDSWFALELYRIALAAGVMFLPALLMGGTFPLVTRAYASRHELGKSLGSLYAANTIGAIFGSFLAGFVLIPWIGRQNSILAASFVNLAAVGLLLGALRWNSVGRAPRWAMALLVLLLVPAWALGLQRWDPRILSSGAYVYADEMAEFGSIREVVSTTNLVYYKEATEASVSVWHDQFTLYLRINGKVDASNHGDMITQKFLSHLPMLYHRGDPREAMMIGLASGVSGGSLLKYPLDRLETIELIPCVAEAARYFDNYNYHVMDDPRHEVIINDGRNHLRLTDQTYDIIVSEPPNPWISGVGSLFTQEFFELVKARLKPGGVACQWLHTYHFHESDLKSALATIVDAYPYVHLWQGAPGDLVVVSSLEPLRLDLDRINRALAGPPGEDLRHLEVLPVEQMLSYYVTDRDGLARYVEGWEDRVTDDNLYLEYTVPRHMFDLSGRTTVLNLDQVAGSPAPYLVGIEDDPQMIEEIHRYKRAHRASLQTFFNGAGALGSTTPEEAWERALEIAPDCVLTRRLLSNAVNSRAISLLQSGDLEEAFTLFERTSTMGDRGERALALNNLGAIVFNAGHLDSARTYWERTLTEEPDFITVYFNLSLIAGADGRPEEVVEFLRRVTRVETNNALAFNNLAWNIALVDGDLEEAERAARHALDIDPRPNFLDTLGYVLLKKRDWSGAEKALARAHEGDPEAMETLFHLGRARAELGRVDEARAAFQAVASGATDPDLARRAREQLSKL